MAPKKKNNKKADDWESELGDAPKDAAAPETKDDAPAEADAEEEFPAGGLMAMLRKKQKKKKGKQAEDFVEGEDPPGAEESDLTEKAPVEASIDDEFALPDKKGKGKNAPAKLANDEGEDDERGADGKVLTKAQKEKLKKEREKQRKKENAAKKKTTAPTKAPEAAKPVADTKVEETASKPAAGGKGKKLPPALAKLQAQQEELKRREAEKARIAAEEKARIEEEERREAEELKQREEAKVLKRQKEKEKIEQQKKDGTYLTKAQREEKLKNEMKLKQMIAAGVKVGSNESGEKKKPVYDNRKKKGGRKNPEEIKAEEERALAEAAERSRQEAEKIAAEAKVKADKAAAEAAAAKEAQDDSDLEDWEVAAAESEDDLKESWDADSDEEREKAAAKKASAENGKAGSKSLPIRDNVEEDSESESESEESSEDEEATAAQAAAAQRKKEALDRREKAHEAAMAARSADNLRSPICCILGHVDTGKTKLLDKIRQTNVQEGEAGGITQQIGATYFPVDAIRQKTAVINKDNSFDFKVPGLLVIDTPGHESFSNLRSRGSSLCNIAILVVDIMHGLEPQTLESMKLLRDRKTPFIVALNKIDRLYGWKKVENNGFQESLALQNKGVQNEFAKRLDDTKVAFAEQGFNSELYYENKSMAKFVSLVPTSAHTGEGIPDMLKLILQLTQERMVGSLMYLSEVQCTVLEVKAIEGFGMTIDVILSNGILREGDKICLCGVDGAITTNVRALLTPAPLKELRLKSAYVHNKEVKAALGVKISAPGLEGAIAGSRLMVIGPDDDQSDIEDEIEADLGALFSRVEKSGRGVTVQASTLGSLEALLDFLKSSKIPVANVGIGPVYKRDVMNCGTMLEKNKEYAVMLCFDVKIDKEAQAYADDQGIKIFTADIIYHLFDAFTKHMSIIAEKKKEESKLLAVFPCVLSPVAVFNKTGPIVVGVDVVEGNLRMHTPIAAVKQNSVTGVKEIINIGRVTGIERDHKQIQICKKGQPSVAVKIEMGNHQPTYGRHLEEKDTLYSLISRASIDTLKEFYRPDVSNDEWLLIKKLKPLFDIP
ncbi:Eukaryotic translation initiation factor 5B [Lachnellula hyalina]|uniref:Eukaryotic translation initiation factor 5B n=1 Tax=Lachnellula hyalina TaxID=1316788 RepID=A0A8H8U3U0_9HELO|nr:Eukaryotic translation initiation factor 5B [Lachnellula hyalina]TVY29517.1 Eukaryotic translation initiation factor 5B [Lachnellula hyalina]